MARRPKHTKEYPVVEVIWIDAEEHGEVGWNDIKDQLAHAKKPCPQMRTVGYLVHRDDGHIALLSTIGEKECSTVEKIPSAFLISVTPLSGTKKATVTASKNPVK